MGRPNGEGGEIRTRVVLVWLARGTLGESLEGPTLQLEMTDGLNSLLCKTALSGNQGALGVGKREDGSAQLNDLESGELRDITRAGDGDKCGGLVEAVVRARAGNHLNTSWVNIVLSPTRRPPKGTHMLDVVDETITGRFWSDEAATPVETLSSEHASELILQLLVSTEQETDFASPSTDVTSYRTIQNQPTPNVERLRGEGRVPGTSVSWPMCLKSSLIKETQNRLISASDLPLGSKSDPPFPPPMFKPVSAFLKVCSKPRNFRMDKLTLGWRRRPPL